MKKRDIIAVLADMTSITKTKAGEVLDALAGIGQNAVAQNGEFALPGIVRLKVINRPARQGRNPATGETIQLPAKRVLKAKADKAISDAAL